MRAATPALPMTDEQRSVLEKLIRSRTAPHRDVVRAQALLMAADGFANTRIAAELHLSPTTVAAWRERFAEDGLVNFSAVRPGRGPKPSIPAEKVEEIVRLTLHEGRNHIVRRTMEHVGHPVRRLSRIGIGPVRLGTLKVGEVRDLTREELGALLDLVERG